MAGLIGERVRRVEDRSLLTGEARYTADIPVHRPLEIAFVRSPFAHACIEAIDASAACAAPGVVAVLTAADVGEVTCMSPVEVPAGTDRPLLAGDVVRFVGDLVAVVVADNQSSAVDAAELVEVHYTPRAPLVDPVAAAGVSPPVYDTLGTNTALSVLGAAGPVFDTSDLVVSMTVHNQRVAVAPLEPLSVLAQPDGAGGLVVHASTQAPHALRNGLAAACGLDPAAVRIIGPWVGGGFGAKSTADPEYALACRVSLQLGRAVRWRQTRSENLATMHGRAQHQRVRLALAADGTLRALHADLVSDNGAYPGANHFMAGLTSRMLAGTYRFDDVTWSIASVVTNTAPPTGYRGAGRPEATSLVERVVDVAARVVGADPVELRRKNLIGSTSFPYETPTGAIYDSGDYARALDRALELARYDERRREQRRRRDAGDRHLLGIGVSCYVEVTAGAGPTEFSDVEVHPDETVTVRVGTFAHGQGHQTTYAQIAADALGLPFESIRVVEGDTSLVARGVGTFGSRSMQVGGASVYEACRLVVDEARRRAAGILEASPDDIVRSEGGFAVAGVPARSVRWSELATGASIASPDETTRAGLHASIDWERPASTYPFGAHVAVVEIDVETGKVALVEHVAVDDCGKVLNPMLAEGQVHGGVAQGVAQALLEEVVHDTDGNVLTSNLADYAFVSATELPSFVVDHTETPTPLNRLGAKGIGESGTIGATPAVHNAVVDALAHLGVLHIDMPCTPEKVWRAIRGESVPVDVLRPVGASKPTSDRPSGEHVRHAGRR